MCKCWSCLKSITDYNTVLTNKKSIMVVMPFTINGKILYTIKKINFWSPKTLYVGKGTLFLWECWWECVLTQEIFVSRKQFTLVIYMSHEMAICLNPHNLSNWESRIATQLGYKCTFCQNVHTKIWLYLFYMIYLLTTAIGLTASGSSTVHIYTQTIHRTTQWNIIPRTEHT